MPKRLVETKHYQLTQRLRKELMILPPGEEVPTLRELTEHLGVSRTTVQTALERLQRDRLIHRPAGRKRFVMSDRHHSAVRNITLIRPDFPSPDWDVVVRSIVRAGKTRRWRFHTHSFSHMENLDLEHGIGESDAAVLLPGAEPFPDQLVASLRRPSMPVVVLAADSGQPEASHVWVDDLEAGRMAARHLLKLGHERVAILIDQPHAPSILQRLEGWRSVMREAGVADLDRLVLDAGIQPYQDSLEGCGRFLKRLLRKGPPGFTALFSTSSTGAITAFSAFRAAGLRVPDDVSVLAYCGEAGIAPYLIPALGGIEVDIAELGNQVADILDTQLKDPQSGPRQVNLPPKLILRESVAAPSPKPAEVS